MIGTSEIYKILSASSTVLSLLTRKGTSPNYVYNIEVAMVEPNDWGINDSPRSSFIRSALIRSLKYTT